MRTVYNAVAVAGALLVASPSFATGSCPPTIGRCGTQVPEPSDLALFVGGVTALLIGRRAGRRSNKGAGQGAGDAAE